VSRSTSFGRGVRASSNEKPCLVAGGGPLGRTRYLPRTEREKLIEVFALTLLAAARIPRLVLDLLEELDFVPDFGLVR
jgi:hypothetical protein